MPDWLSRRARATTRCVTGPGIWILVQERTDGRASSPKSSLQETRTPVGWPTEFNSTAPISVISILVGVVPVLQQGDFGVDHGQSETAEIAHRSHFPAGNPKTNPGPDYSSGRPTGPEVRGRHALGLLDGSLPPVGVAARLLMAPLEVGTALTATVLFAHPGGLDSKGGHHNRKTGESRYRRGAGSGTPARTQDPNTEGLRARPSAGSDQTPTQGSFRQFSSDQGINPLIGVLERRDAVTEEELLGEFGKIR